MYLKVVKRLLDILLSFIALVVFSPILLILIIWIKIDSPGPVLFKQERLGKDKKLFKIFKFRTMYVNTPKYMPTHLLQDADQYITKCGHFLRKTSLDELPQLVNILIGQMSIVGPRPALAIQEDLIQARDEYGANNILPGLTGYAQINGRDELPILKKAELDGYYVKHLSFLLDVKIVFITAFQVVKSDGVVEGKKK